jgi:CHAD domain-containing protein
LALRRVHRTLDSARYDRFLDTWERFLAQPVPARSRLPNSLRPIDALASERIARSYRRVLRKGKRIERDSPPEALHKLRIEAKKLRYLLEFFSVLYPGDFATGSIRDLKKLQDHLGEINDLAVQSAMLKEIESRLATESDSGPSVIAAARLLRRELLLSQARLATTFHERFETFAGPRVKKRFRALVASTESVP